MQYRVDFGCLSVNLIMTRDCHDETFDIGTYNIYDRIGNNNKL